MASEEPTLSDLMPGFALPDADDGPDVVAIPESVEEQRLLDPDPEDPTMDEDHDGVPPSGVDVGGVEVLPPQPSTTTLSAKELMAAQADAAGVSRSKIAAMVGLSTASIAQFRQRPEYQAEVERIKNTQTSDLDLPLQLMYTNLIIGTNEAIETLKLALNAVDDHGKPLWTTRLRAAEKLTEMGVEFGKTKTATGKEAGGGIVTNGSGAVVLVLKEG